MTDYIKRDDAVNVVAICTRTEDIVAGYPIGKEAVRICPKCKKLWNRLVLERKEK